MSQEAVPVKARPEFLNVDQEAWVLKRLEELLELHKAILLNRITWPSTSAPMVDAAIDGAVQGVASEIIRTLGLKPCYVNLRERSGSHRQMTTH